MLTLFSHLVYQYKSRFDQDLVGITEFLQKVMNHSTLENKMKKSFASSYHKPDQTMKIVFS
jgi:hypothetical protein